MDTRVTGGNIVQPDPREGLIRFEQCENERNNNRHEAKGERNDEIKSVSHGPVGTAHEQVFAQPR